MAVLLDGFNEVGSGVQSRNVRAADGSAGPTRKRKREPMANNRKAIPADARRLVLHEAGYKCANPACRTILTLDIHHLEYVAVGGGDTADNLLPLCPDCHTLHHQGFIPAESVRAWKMLLLALNEALDRHSVELLLLLERVKQHFVSGDGVLQFASLIAAGLVEWGGSERTPDKSFYHMVELTEKGKQFVAGWKKGDQQAALSGLAPTV